MPVEQQSQVYQFTLNFQSIKMRVKFPCRLSLQHGGTILTNEVSAKQQNKFIINEEVVIKDQSEKKLLQITVNLITEKGAKYIAGIIKLFHNELLRSEGQRIVVALVKCLDAQSFCELKVQKIVTQKVARRNPLIGATKTFRDNENQQHSFSPAQQQANIRSANQISNGLGTRSEAQFVLNNQKSGDALTYYQKNRPSPPKTRRKIGDTSKARITSTLKIKQQQNTNRQKLIQAQVYKQNYQKLKEKYRKQSQSYKTELAKRIALENNQNNYKLQIMRLRLKCEELEKSYNEKNLKLRDTQAQLSLLQQKDIDLNYYKEEAGNLKNNIAMLEDTIITLNTENQKIKDLSKEREHQWETKFRQVETQYEKVKNLYETKQAQYERDVRVLKEQLIQLEYELHSKTQQLQKEKNYIYEFQKTSQSKLFEFDTLVQNQRNINKQKLQEVRSRLQKLQLQNKQLLTQKKQLENQRQAHKSYVMKCQYQYKLQAQQLNTLKNQLQQLTTIREKCNKLTVQVKTLKEEKQTAVRNLQKLLKSKQSGYDELLAQGKRQLDSVKRANLQLTEKHKLMIQKNIEYEGLAEQLKNTIEKNRRSLEIVTKDFTDLKQKEKQLKKQLNDKDEQIDQLKDKLQKSIAKHNSLQQSKRAQSQKSTQLINNLKLSLQSQQSRVSKLQQTTSQLTHQLSRLKMLLQFSQQKLQKATSSAQQKYKSYEGIVGQHQGVITMLEENINVMKTKENELVNRLNQVQNQLNFSREQCDKVVKDNKILSEKIIALEGINRQKASQYTALSTKYENSQKLNQSLEHQLHQVKTQLSLTKGQKDKTIKLLEISLLQQQKSKESISKLNNDTYDKDTRLQLKAKELFKCQEELQRSYQAKEALGKEYAKFKESISELMSSSMRQFDGLRQETMAMIGGNGVMGNTTMGYSANGNEWTGVNKLYSTSQSSRHYPNLNTSPNDLTSFTSQIISSISTFNKQTQQTLSRLLQKNRLLTKQLQTTRQQLSSQRTSLNQLRHQSSNQLQQLQQQLQLKSHQNSSQSSKYESVIQQLRQQLYQKDSLVQQLHSQLDQLQFTLSSNKMDYDASLNEIDKKNYQLKQFVQELEEKAEFQHNVITSLQQKCYELDKQIIDLKSVIVAEKELSYKKQTQLNRAKQQYHALEVMLQTQKQKVSKLNQLISNLQVQLATQKQTRQKLQKQLNEQQQKKKQLKAFSAHVIKEKQSIIKQELEHHQKLQQLENRLLETQHHKGLLLEEIQGLKQQINAYKGEIKRTVQGNKELQRQLVQQRGKITDLEKVIKEREKAIMQSQNKIKQLNKQSQTKQQQAKKTITQLNQQIIYIAHHKQKLTQDLNQKLLQSQKQLKALEGIINEQKSQSQQLEQTLYSYKEKSRVLQETLTHKQNELSQLRYKIEHLEAMQHQLEQESKDKEENMYELSATVYQLESRISALVKEKQAEIEEVHNDWNLKYQDLYQQLQQRFQLIQKEKQYLKEQLAQKQAQLTKKTQSLKTQETDSLSAKKLLQDKLKKLQQQRLTLLTTKNIQIQKLSQQIKQHLENNKKRQAQNRKLAHQLEIARNQIIKLDNRIGEYDQKIKSINKLYQQELEEMKKKQLIGKNFKEQVLNQQWNTQRQIRKALQAFTKSLLAWDQDNKEKSQLMALVKTLETTIISSIKMFDEKP